MNREPVRSSFSLGTAQLQLGAKMRNRPPHSSKRKGRTMYTPENPNVAVPPGGTSQRRARVIWTAVSQHRFHFCSCASNLTTSAPLQKIDEQPKLTLEKPAKPLKPFIT